MGWNGSGRCSKNTRPLQVKRKKNISITFVIATMLFFISVVVILSFKTGDEDHKKGKQKTSLSTKEKRPTKPIRKCKREKFIPKLKPNKTSKISVPEIKDANIFFKPKIEGRLVIWKIQNPPVFTNQFEDFVATVLTAVPGERFLETDLADDFDDSFYESLKNTITIEPNDSEIVIEMKNAVIEAREEVRKLVEQGERPRDIVLAARNELNKIADYRDRIQAEFNEFLIAATDPKEVFLFRNEANAILQEYGAAPIDGPHDEETAYEMMEYAKEEKLKELDNESTNK